MPSKKNVQLCQRFLRSKSESMTARTHFSNQNSFYTQFYMYAFDNTISIWKFKQKNVNYGMERRLWRRPIEKYEWRIINIFRSHLLIAFFGHKFAYGTSYLMLIYCSMRHTHTHTHIKCEKNIRRGAERRKKLFYDNFNSFW